MERQPLRPPFSPGAAPSAHGSISTAMDLLPTIARTPAHDAFLTETDIDTYLHRDLDLSRLNKIHSHLWMAGRPMNSRPLHRQRMMGLEIFPTEQSDLHLLKFSNRILIKPLPAYIFSHDFWSKHLCASKELHESASGLLVSYIWLVCSPVDLRTAQDANLLPSTLDWPAWKSFVHDVFNHININALDTVNKRYHFGELRLSRVNTIYRVKFFFTHFIRGYLYGYNRYQVFFERNFGWILVVFVYFSLVLSAMQVALDVPGLGDNKDFVRATYGFVIFSIVIVAFFLGVVGVIFGIIFFYNMAAAIHDDRLKRLQRRKLASQTIADS
ncbi:predicted protein [Uncinocarpus reesii 1704]|uniref:Uncharacterized protein n=1 Tax=Uncinocarpus reesii (strain UAMH 1704) TaxID=336963 RepID=C4JPB6_UNCRE|nr:uncharacterized protein UREG_04498 [Uncinocarpus reesii 1704]EEP79652.1 predicted protein [Uncinocarpus reesii 1704]